MRSDPYFCACMQPIFKTQRVDPIERLRFNLLIRMHITALACDAKVEKFKTLNFSRPTASSEVS